ncbi:hypothetical protein COB57_04305 [Candidatus Peregrinibacteria bacterium]|nr:MAG: hypothetical protein COB57_04305 [Candidatus Peregrinibacteria bacterium]
MIESKTEFYNQIPRSDAILQECIDMSACFLDPKYFSVFYKHFTELLKLDDLIIKFSPVKIMRMLQRANIEEFCIGDERKENKQKFLRLLGVSDVYASE